MVAGGILVSLVAIVFARLAYGLILPPVRDDLGLQNNGGHCARQSLEEREANEVTQKRKSP